MKATIIFVLILFGETTAVEINSTESSENHEYFEPGPGARITYGKPAKHENYQFIVALIIKLENGQQSFCGGSIISHHWILTAAHCTINAKSIEIRGGSSEFGTPQFSRNASKIVFHPDYSNSTFKNDISVIKLSSSLQNVKNVKVLRLPKKSQENDGFINLSTTVIGWGATITGGSVSPRLMVANMKTISSSYCKIVYPKITVTTICATGDFFIFQGVCPGDSGGPMLFKEDNEWTQIGLVSFGLSLTCQIGVPAGFTRVSHFHDWIHKETGVSFRA